MISNIKASRLARGMVCEDLARRVGITPQNLKRIESGEVVPTALLERAILAALKDRKIE
jgi:ribosome-binding protein aMBF1 (putative translation factor)